MHDSPSTPDPASADLAAAETASDPAGVGPVTAGTERLVRSAEQLDAEALRMPSRCEGWSRGHVLSHLARNADGLTNLLTWASTGVETPMYPNAEARTADIEAGAARGLDEIIDDLRSSAQRFSAAVAAVPDDAWERQVRLGPGGGGRAIPARRVLWQRLQEVEIHHVDLDTGYLPDNWAPWFVSRALAETLRRFGRRDDVPALTLVVDGTAERLGSAGGPTVTGAATPVLGWLTGRSAGHELQVDPPGQLPTLPAWG
ncbi:MAG: maleylpyruvate isomerase family mycothiol-dependent enzyme [Jiangellaceae bacterium]